jgi:hypothetical protein
MPERCGCGLAVNKAYPRDNDQLPPGFKLVPRSSDAARDARKARRKARKQAKEQHHRERKDKKNRK